MRELVSKEVIKAQLDLGVEVDVSVNTWLEDNKEVKYFKLETEYTLIVVRKVDNELGYIMELDLIKVTNSNQNRIIGNFLNGAIIGKFEL